MAVYAKGRQWQANFTVKGKRFRKSFETKAEAEAFELNTRADLKLGKKVVVNQTSVGGGDKDTLQNVLRSAETLHWSRLRGSHRTVLNAQTFVTWAGPLKPARVAFTDAGIRDYVKHLIEDRRVSNSTLNRYMSAISVLMNHADLDKRPTLPWFKPNKGRVRFFSPEEEQAVIALLTQWDQHRWCDLFMFLNDTGLRPWAEACKAPWKNVKDTKITVLGKNDEWRDVPLTARARAVLARCPRDQAGPFTDLMASPGNDLWDRVRGVMPVLDDTVWYTCRHTFASRLVMAGTHLKAVAVLMGNTYQIVASTYAHLSPDHLAGAVDALENFGRVGDNRGDRLGDRRHQR